MASLYCTCTHHYEELSIIIKQLPVNIIMAQFLLQQQGLRIIVVHSSDMFVSSSIVPPLPPSGLSAVHTSPTTIRVYWTPPANGTTPTGYNITYFAGVDDTIGKTVSDSHEILSFNSSVTYRVSIVSVNGTTHSDPPTGPVLAARRELCWSAPYSYIAILMYCSKAISASA